VTTAVAPDGWRERLVIRDTAATAPGREKDLEFADALIAAGFIDPYLLLERIGLLSRATDRERERLYR
jgi:hypothetical protein